jgi:hypothetical protein
MSDVRKLHYQKNKDWYKQKHSEWYQANKESHNEKVFTRILKQKYNLTREEYVSLLENNPKCNICKNPYKRIGYVDHCHETGNVRGVLCMSCNTGLGHFKDNISSLEAAIEYLKGINDKRI